MYSTSATFDDLEHESNWICPACQQENDKSKVLCKTKECDYINLIKYPAKSIEYEELPINVQRDLLLHGFIRMFYSTKVIPADILGLINEYFPFELEWDINRHGKNATFPEYNTVTNSLNKPALVVANNIINSKQYDEYKWKIKLRHCGYPLYLGYIILPISDSIDWNMQEFGKNENQIGIYCYEYQGGIYLTPSIRPRPPTFYHRMHTLYASTTSVRRGSVFTFHMDFKTKTCHIYHNDKIIECRRTPQQPINLYPKSEILQQSKN